MPENQTYPSGAKAHIGLAVENVARSAMFYRALLGAEPVKVRTGYIKFDVESPPLNLSLNQVPVNGGQALPTHYGIQVHTSEDVQAANLRLKEAGLSTRVEDEVACCHALQDKVWARDPDGNEWEVFTVLADIPEQAGEETKDACCAPECCVG